MCHFVQVQGMNSLVAELANVAKQERELLSQCKDLMSTVAALRVRVTYSIFQKVFGCPPNLNLFEYFGKTDGYPFLLGTVHIRQDTAFTATILEQHLLSALRE